MPIRLAPIFNVFSGSVEAQRNAEGVVAYHSCLSQVMNVAWNQKKA
jgi:hypothetical protein